MKQSDILDIEEVDPDDETIYNAEDYQLYLLPMR